MSSKMVRVLLTILAVVATGAAVAGICYVLINGGMAGSKKEIAIAALAAALPVLVYVAATKPFIFPFGLYVLLVPFDNLLSVTPRYGTVTKLVAICAALAFVFAFIRNRKIVTPDRALYAWLGLLVWMSLSVFWALDSDDASSKIVTYAELIGLYAVISFMPISRFEFRVFTWCVLLGALAASVYAIHLFHSGTDLLRASIDNQQTARVIVQSGESHIDPNAFGAALMLPIAIVATEALRRRWSFSKLAYIGALLLLLGGIYVTASRGAMLAVATLVGYLIWKSRYRLQLIVASVLGLTTVLVLTNPFARFGNALKTGGAGRLDIWKVGIEALRQHWLIGAGVGNFPDAYDKGFIFVHQLYYAHWHRASHNTPLAIAVELGVVGLIIAAVAWLRQLRMLSFIPRWSNFYDLRIALEGSFLAVSVTSMFLETLDSKFLWLAFQFMLVTRTLARAEIVENPPPHLAWNQRELSSPTTLDYRVKVNA
jgi:O-antigen ligase